MFCIYCGTKLSDEARFCSACGKPVTAPGEEAKTPPAVEPVKEKSVPKKKRKEKPAKGKKVREKPIREKKVREKKVRAKPKREKADAAAAGPKKKLFGKLPVKLLGAVAAVVVVILAVVLISNAVEEKKRTTIVGAIPDPESFFGVAGRHNYYDYVRYEHDIIFRQADVTEEMALAYVELLRSGEYPFQMTQEIIRDTGTWKYEFEYNGGKELYDSYRRQIQVSYNPDHSSSAVMIEIENSKNFSLVTVGGYGGVNAGQQITPVESPVGQEKPSKQEQPAAPGNTAAQSGTAPSAPAQGNGGQWVAAEISVDSAIEVPENAVPELAAWSNGEAEAETLPSGANKKVDYEADAAVIGEYIQALQANGFTLIDEYYFSYKDTFQSWAFTCDAMPGAKTIEMAYEDTPCHVCIWKGTDDGEYRVDISPTLQFFDTGLRRGGSTAKRVISGPSAGAGLLRLDNGSYQTSDGRLSTAVGNAMVIRDGATYHCEARWEADKEVERLWVEDYYRSEGFVFEVPGSSLMEGDVLLASDLMRERYYTTEKAGLDNYNWGGPMFAMAYNGMWQGPLLNESDYETLTVRVMYYQPGGEAVYYVYAKLNYTQPSEVEALVAVNLSNVGGTGSGSFGDATRMKVGDTVNLSYTGEVFGASGHVYEWSVAEGEENVSITGTGTHCKVTAQDEGVATVTVSYRYTVTEADVLTGLPTTATRAKSRSYNFIIE